MNCDHLRYFIEAAKESHIIRAAQNLNITQSTLSRAIANLEEEIGVKLFDKVGRNVQLTPEGKLYAEKVTLALELLDQGADEARHMSEFVKGEVTIGSTESILANEFPNILYNFLLKYPDVEIHTQTNGSRINAKFVTNKNLDMAFCAGDIDYEKEFPKLSTQIIREEEIVLIVPKDHELAGRREVTVGELENYEFLSFSEGSGINSTLCRIFDKEGCEFKISKVVTGESTLIHHVERGAGLAFLGQDTARLASSQIWTVHLRCRNTIPTRYVCLVWRNDGYLAQSGRTFRDFVIEEYSKMYGAVKFRDFDDISQ